MREGTPLAEKLPFLQIDADNRSQPGFLQEEAGYIPQNTHFSVVKRSI
jgi:hypothetical protein